MCKKLKKSLSETMDKFIDPVKLFGHPIDDFEFDKMSLSDRNELKKLLKDKMERLTA